MKKYPSRLRQFQQAIHGDYQELPERLDIQLVLVELIILIPEVCFAILFPLIILCDSRTVRLIGQGVVQFVADGFSVGKILKDGAKVEVANN